MIDKNQIHHLDTLIRSGSVHHAAREIFHIFKNEKIQENERSMIANLARRSGLPLLSLKILTPLVSKEKKGLRNMSNSELLSYAAGLISLGAHQEGQELLFGSQLQSESQKWFFLGISSMNQWEYKSAKNYFQRYLACTDLTSYQTQTARLNLTTSLLVLGENDSALQMIEKAQQTIHPIEEKLLHYYFMEQKVQWLIAVKKYTQALESIQQIQRQDFELPLNYRLTLKKWSLATHFYTGQISPADLNQQLNTLEHEAYHRSMPELLREIDFYRALFLKDGTALSRIYYGTSWKPYLLRIQENIGKYKFSHNFIWKPRSWQRLDHLKNLKKNTLYDIQNPENIRHNGLQHKLIWILSSDLYRQHSLGSLFHSLYPHEKFDPWTSKDRLLKMIQRTQHSINAYHPNEVLKICNTRNRFYLRFDSPLILPYRPHHLQQEIKNEPILIAIYHKMKFQLFSNKDIRQLTGMSESQVYEELAKLSSRRLIDQYHRNGHRMYKISKKTIHPATEAKTAGNFFA